MYSDSTERIKDKKEENNESATTDGKRIRKILGMLHRSDI